MPFSDTSNKTGLIQRCEFWTGLGDGGISGNATLLKQFTVGFNVAFDEVVPIIFSSDAKWQWDDSNHTDQPIATLDLESGRSDYSFTADEDGNSILELRAVYLQDADGAWTKLESVDADHAARGVLAQATDNIGGPTRYDKIGSTIWLDVTPNYSRAAAIRLVFSRSQSYFVSGDTSKKPGIPRPFHELLALIASRNWIAVSLPEATILLNTVKEAIAEAKAGLKAHLSKRARDEKTVMRAATHSSR